MRPVSQEVDPKFPVASARSETQAPQVRSPIVESAKDEVDSDIAAAQIIVATKPFIASPFFHREILSKVNGRAA
jgi:hypothetical protein